MLYSEWNQEAALASRFKEGSEQALDIIAEYLSTQDIAGTAAKFKKSEEEISALLLRAKINKN